MNRKYEDRVGDKFDSRSNPDNLDVQTISSTNNYIIIQSQSVLHTP